MAILQNTDCNSKQEIIGSFSPFSNPESIDGMIIGNDLDALMSACLLKKHYNWDILGIYDLTRIWHGIPLPELAEKIDQNKIVAIDLDIYHSKIPSVGHHILTMTPNDTIPGHAKSLNPNLIRGIHNSQFRRKYPLGTIHFLLWLLDETSHISDSTRDLAWLVDSSYINGQSHRYRDNVGEWIRVYFNDPAYLRDFEMIDTLEFEERIKTLINTIAQTGVAVSRGQVESKHLRLRGGQCQFKNPNSERENVLRIFRLISEITKWNIPTVPDHFDLFNGIRNVSNLSDTVTYNRMDNFLHENSVFSYVLPGQSKINYTNGISFI